MSFPAYSLYSGRGYVFDPMSHGPLQFHLITLSYAIFGDNDFSTRIPAALFGITIIAIGLLLFRRYLGRTGAIAAGILLLISPFLLFYGRYARNEIFIVLWAILLIYSVLRYLEKGEPGMLYLYILANAFHFTDKATSYMFAGGIFIFLLFYFIDHVSRREWTLPRYKISFLLGVILSIILLLAAVTLYSEIKPETGTYASTVPTSSLTAEESEVPSEQPALLPLILVIILSAGGAGAFIWAGISIVRGLGWQILRMERSLDLLLLIGTLILPLVSAIPLMVLGYQPNDYTTIGSLRIAITVIILGGISAALGIWWFGKRWIFFAVVFYLPIIVLYTTFFTQPNMLGSGFVGSFTYWFQQHFEGRGGQPLFYYALVEIPIYEYLPALGLLTATVIAITRRLWRSAPGKPFLQATEEFGQDQPVPVIALLVYWSIFTLVIFSFAGEKMPWITCHITLPMILASAWAIGWLIETKPWVVLAKWDWRLTVRAIILISLAY